MNNHSDSRPVSPDLSGFHSEGLDSPHLGSFNNNHRFPLSSAFGGLPPTPYYQPTSVPQQSPYNQYYHDSSAMAPRRRVKAEDADEDEYMPDARPTTRSSRVKQEPSADKNEINGIHHDAPVAEHMVKGEDGDPTLGCTLNTSFPVARIKRIMQADEDIGKVAQVTPTVVSRALELFMIKLISAAAHQANGTGAGGQSKGPKRVLAQHFKKAVLADEKFDFLNEIVQKVPDAPAKQTKKEAGSDSEDAKPKRSRKKRKSSGEDV